MTTVTEIAHLRDRIIELLEELDKERNLIAAMREHIERAHEQVERSNQTIKQWIESFVLEHFFGGQHHAIETSSRLLVMDQHLGNRTGTPLSAPRMERLVRHR
jgi:hypothetical protein